jgi:ubiquinone/menaquinone biosynthesis C-methylase UbiE
LAWYEKWFKQDYLRLYSHRDKEEAGRQVGFLVERLDALLGMKSENVIDVACGTGRHALEFIRRGWTAVGIDLSEELLLEAKKELPQLGPEKQECLSYLLGDMRELPFEDHSFSLLTNFFTGFGYFDTDLEHQSLLQEWSRVVRPDGAVFIDYLNRDFVIEHLEAKSEIENAKFSYIQKRSLVDNDKRVKKSIQVIDKDSGECRTFEESVRMYSLGELEGFLRNSNLEIIETWGDFNGTAFSAKTPRLMILAKH